LAISVSPSYQTSVTASRPETSFDNVDSEKPSAGKEAKRSSTAGSVFPSLPRPWGAEMPTYYYAYQGQPVSGVLSLQNRPARVRPRCTTDIIVDDERSTMSVRLDLEPLLGAAETIDLFVSHSVEELWNWKGAAVQETRPLPIVEIARYLTAL